MTINYDILPEIVKSREDLVADGVLGRMATSTIVDGVQLNRVTYFPKRSLLESAISQGAKIEDL